MQRLSFIYALRATCNASGKSISYKIEAEDTVQANMDAKRDSAYKRWKEKNGLRERDIRFEILGKKYA